MSKDVWIETEKELPKTCGYIVMWNKTVYTATTLYWVGSWEHEAHIKANYTHWKHLSLPN